MAYEKLTDEQKADIEWLKSQDVIVAYSVGGAGSPAEPPPGPGPGVDLYRFKTAPDKGNNQAKVRDTMNKGNPESGLVYTGDPVEVLGTATGGGYEWIRLRINEGLYKDLVGYVLMDDADYPFAPV